MLPVLKKQLSSTISFVGYMSPLPAPEVPVVRVRVGTAQHPDAKWPLFLYNLKPSESDLTADAPTTATTEQVTVLQDSTLPNGANSTPAAEAIGSVNAAPAAADEEFDQRPENEPAASSTAAAESASQ